MVRLFLPALGAIVLTSLPVWAADKTSKTVWDGVYSAVQADRGQMAYATSCGRCHGEDLRGSGNVLLGPKFLEKWREDSLKSLFTGIRNTMPRNAPKSLPDDVYTDIVAFLLQANAFPVGKEELKTETLDSVLVVTKEGPKPVPDFALVVVAGCLANPSADTWVLKQATEPVRTRNPRESTATEMAESAAKAPGQHTFRLLDTLYFTPAGHAGHWMEAKGFLIRTPGDDKVNLTALRVIRETCAAADSR